MGLQCRKGKRFTNGEKLGTNMHCLIVFERIDQEEGLAQAEEQRKEEREEEKGALKLIKEEPEDKWMEDEDGEVEDYVRMVQG